MRNLVALIIICLCYPLSASAQAASSTVICKKRSNGAITLRTRRCSASETKVTNITALTGATGPTGSTGAPGSAGSEGADGALRIYGDGSSGALNVATTTLWSGSEALGQYTDCSIAAGVTLTVSTGTVLRCSGSFTNEGTIVVTNYYLGPEIGGVPASGGMLPNNLGASTPSLGWGRVAAGNGGYGTNLAAVAGGGVGFALPRSVAANILRPGTIGGGAGGSPVGAFGASGGGTLTVLAKGAIVNKGTIQVNGVGGGSGLGGGGAGGIIILASKESVLNGVTGTLEADGGPGSDSNIYRASGGGGGGGLIHILSPVINMLGASSVLGGAAGDSSVNVTNSPRSGGGGGGSMVGAGGAGGTVATNNTISGTAAGENGLVIQTLTDPTSLF